MLKILCFRYVHGLFRILYRKITQKSIKVCERKSNFVCTLCLRYFGHFRNTSIHSTMPIFNLSTQPLILPDSKHTEIKQSKNQKRTPNSRKCLVFKPFSIFTSILLTAILRTLHDPFPQINPTSLLLCFFLVLKI